MFRDPFSTDLQTRTPPVRKPQAAYGSRYKLRFCKNWSTHGQPPLREKIHFHHRMTPHRHRVASMFVTG